MENKDIFLKQIASFQNFRSKLRTRNTLLEKVFGADTTVMDVIGLDELESCLIDLLYVMFAPFGKMTHAAAQEEISWFLYEWDGRRISQISVEDQTYTIKTPEEYWNYLIAVYG